MASAGVADADDGEAAMAAPAARRIVGAEVPIPGSDKLRWIDLTIPSSSAAAPASPSDPFVCVPPRAASGCHIIPSGDSQYYLSWYVLGFSSLSSSILWFCSDEWHILLAGPRAD
jgi:nuclear pore complex protein Nup160